jgi:hypothetical protein
MPLACGFCGHSFAVCFGGLLSASVSSFARAFAGSS